MAKLTRLCAILMALTQEAFNGREGDCSFRKNNKSKSEKSGLLAFKRYAIVKGETNEQGNITRNKKHLNL